MTVWFLDLEQLMILDNCHELFQCTRIIKTTNKKIVGVVKPDVVKPDVVVPDGVGRAAMLSISGIEVGTRVCAVASGGS